MMKHGKKIIFAVIIITVVSMSIYAVKKAREDGGGTPVKQTQNINNNNPNDLKVQKVSLKSEVFVSGTVEANDSRSISYLGGGIVDSVSVKEGDEIEAGQILAKINSDQIDAEIMKLENSIEIGKIELSSAIARGSDAEEITYINAKKANESLLANNESNRLLIENGGISQIELEQSKYDLEVSKLSLDMAKKSLDNAKGKQNISIMRKNLESLEISLDNLVKNREKTVISSPIAGTITSLNAKAGEILPQDGVLLKIEDLDNKIVKTNVSEAEINKIKVGQEVTITGMSIKGENFLGEVSYISPGTIRDNNTRNVNVAVEVKLNENVESLRPGFNVNLVILAAKKDNILAVPYEAITSEVGGSKFVSKFVEGDAEPVKIQVETGIEGDLLIEITSGDLVEGDILIAQN